MPVGLTGTVSELEAQVGPPETVYGNGQFDHLAPAGAVVVVEHEGAILAGVGLAAAQADAILKEWGRIGLSSLSLRPFPAFGRAVIISHAARTLSVSPSA